MSPKRKLLLIEPHSDDGIISAGGFLDKYRHAFEYDFFLVVASSLPLKHSDVQSRDERLQEFQDYVSYFNGTWHRFDNESDQCPLDMDCMLDMYPKRNLVAQIEKVINISRPDVLMCTGPSFHHDHTAVYDAMIAATRPTSSYYPKEILILENPTYMHFSDTVPRFIPDTYVSLNEAELERKLNFFSTCFKSQVREGDNALSVEGIRSWARYRGIEARSTYAEAFKTFSRLI